MIEYKILLPMSIIQVRNFSIHSALTISKNIYFVNSIHSDCKHLVNMSRDLLSSNDKDEYVASKYVDQLFDFAKSDFCDDDTMYLIMILHCGVGAYRDFRLLMKASSNKHYCDLVRFIYSSATHVIDNYKQYQDIAESTAVSIDLHKIAHFVISNKGSEDYK